MSDGELTDLFLRARREENVRQQYFDEVWRAYSLENVERLVYDPGGDAFFERAAMLYDQGHVDDSEMESYLMWLGRDPDETLFSVLMPPALFGVHRPQTIFATPSVFSYDGVVHEQILSDILDHELVHVRQNNYGLDLCGGVRIDNSNVAFVDWQLLHIALEAQAYHHQFLQADRWGAHKDEIKEECLTQLQRYRQWVRGYLQDSLETNLEKEVLEALFVFTEPFAPAEGK